MKKAQASIGILFGLGMVFILFGVAMLFINERNLEVKNIKEMKEELQDCHAISNAIVSTLTSGPQTTYTIEIFHNLTISSQSRLITTNRTQCTFPVRDVMDASNSEYFTLSPNTIKIENINNTIILSEI